MAKRSKTVETPLEHPPNALMELPPSSSDDQATFQRITPEKAGLIVRIKQKNPAVTHQEIADAIGCHASTVTRWLQILDTDTVPEARKLAKSQALRASLKLNEQIDHTDPRVSQGAAKAVVALAGVQEGTAQVAVGVQVIIGSAASPAGPDPFDNVTIETQPQVID